MPEAESIQEAAGNWLAMIYKEQRQETVAQGVVLRPSFEVCARDTEYKGGGRRSKVWWCQEATEKQLWATLEDSQEAKRRKSSSREMGM